MNCLDEGLMQAYIDNELSDVQRLDCEVHLKACVPCRKQHAEMKRHQQMIVEALNQLSEPFEVPEFTLQEPKPMQRRKRLSFWVPVSAACLLLMLMLTTYQPQQTILEDIYLYQNLGEQVDANLPFTQQEFTITIIEGSAVNVE